jgi:hypothetical protein
MPDITLSNDDLQAVAMACRIAGRQAERDAAGQENPRIRKGFIDSAARYCALATRFEDAIATLGRYQEIRAAGGKSEVRYSQHSGYDVVDKLAGPPPWER